MELPDDEAEDDNGFEPPNWRIDVVVND